MRKTAAIVLIFAVAALSCAVYASIKLNALHEAVTVTESVVYGDPAEARGVTVSMKPTFMNHLSWDVSCEPYPNVKTESAFNYSPNGVSYNYGYGRFADNSATVCILSADFSIHSSVDIDFDDEEYNSRMMLRGAKEVAERTPAGQTHTETIRLSDYYDYCLVILEGHFRRDDGISSSFVSCDISDYFKIPIGNAMQKITITKNFAGAVTELESTVTELPYTGFSSFSEDRSIYFVMSDANDPAQQNDLICRGIYRASFPEDERYHIENSSNIELLFPMDIPATDVQGLLSAHDGRHMLLFTRDEDSRLRMRSIDMETAEVKDEHVLDTTDYYDIYVKESGILLFNYTASVIYLSHHGDGAYSVETQSDIPAEIRKNNHYYFNVSDFDFDGGRLALLTSNEDWPTSYYDSGFVLSIYEDTSLTYMGRYTHSLAKASPLGINAEMPTVKIK